LLRRASAITRSISMTQLSGLIMAEQQAAAAERPTKLPKLPSPRVWCAILLKRWF